MLDAYIDSSVLIGLHFRHAGERAACEESLPLGGGRVSSRYVVFEIARGFLRHLIELHNLSYEYARFSDLHLAAHSGRRIFKKYEMHTWLGAIDDFSASLEDEGGAFRETDKIEMLRAMLRQVIRRGWNKLLTNCSFINETGCQPFLAKPELNIDQRLVQELPVSRCGHPNACGIQSYLALRRSVVDNLNVHLEGLSDSKKGNDTNKHVEGLRYLLERSPGVPFKGEKCHQCGDAIICMEAPQNHVIATKNKGDFEPIAAFLGKQLNIAKTATTTSHAPP